MSDDKNVAIGLASNKDDKRFKCGNCEFFDGGTCHHKNPKLNMRRVEPKWCCNLFNRPGMKTIVE